ncbi:MULTISPECIES: hypothetical protein [Ralstonia solanacearum species complex]|uniref:Photosystem I assembly protein Ycf3 n=3 Tax=Ralstonia solanacearum species complex TaxID=3116862 RepID=A0A0S4VMN1_RALSL|nr:MULTISPECIES: hypothetical protein [Ralstonia]ARU24277.1 hypothetical protein RSSE_p0076 [Ralstonia solanacearum]AXW16565.1 hypothetical protein CJO84_17825 [Ralstonia solanacearum]AXW40214.1 hypothetical protein CJO89_18175 [Ralstonia solanacearum]AXW73006.1 hypothetical protein CJO96_17530 [Ralstonia solanacearum]AYA48459.1 photosystem I assembly protein Ycf3 [Ralstonia pseudosolanacearum]
MKRLTALVLIPVLAGCVSAVSERVSANYTRLGAAAQEQGDWDAARRAYARATLNADEAGLPADRRAIVHYEYGRSLGATCFFEQSERELHTAYELDQRAGHPVYLSLIELARLMLDQQKFVQSTTYFERALPALDAAGAAAKAPAAYADILDEYAQALTGAERSTEASTVLERADALRGDHPGKRSITDRTPYGKFCRLI